ncbi:hypothetical protein ACEQ8H_006251 [Pleosporales sp. CAS-2024a]
MRRSARSVLGKRQRAKMDAEPSSQQSPRQPKRRANPTARRIQTRSESSKAAMGLVTPEPRVLTEPSQSPAVSPKPLAQKDMFPFMDLPAELRLHIYHMALVRADPIPLHISRVQEDKQVHVGNSANANHNAVLLRITNTPPPPPPSRHAAPTEKADQDDPPPPADPVVPVLLRLNKQIYKEARQLLYSENTFTLNLASGIHTLSSLHQRSRSLIKHVVLTIPSHHDILDGFADLVRLGLRYCWGLKSFKIILQASLPDDGRIGGATSVYANAFHILRWLPRGCSVALEGCVSETVRNVVVEEGRLMNVLDEVSPT